MCVLNETETHINYPRCNHIKIRIEQIQMKWQVAAWCYGGASHIPIFSGIPAQAFLFTRRAKDCKTQALTFVMKWLLSIFPLHQRSRLGNISFFVRSYTVFDSCTLLFSKLFIGSFPQCSRLIGKCLTDLLCNSEEKALITTYSHSMAVIKVENFLVQSVSAGKCNRPLLTSY